jgi:phage gp29-like protein
MADPAPEKPLVDVEVAVVGNDDLAAHYADELKLPRDAVLRTRGDSDLRVYAKVKTDSQVLSTWQQRTTAVISKPWDLEPGDEDPASVECCAFIKENLQKLPFDDITRKMLNGIYYGYQPGECMWKAEGSNILLGGIKVRAPYRFRFDRDDNLRLITKSNRKGEVMPPRKFWLFTAGGEDDDDPYGLGLGHYLYWPVFLKRGGMRFWSLFVEQMARGRFGATVPAGTKDDVILKVKQTLAQLTGGGSVVVTDNVAIKLHEALRNSGGDYFQFLSYLDAMISKINLSQTMTTDSGASYSQSKVHEGVADEVTSTDADLICGSCTTQPIKWLQEWNYPTAKPPRLWRDTAPATNQKASADRDKILYELGWEPTEEHIQEEYGPNYVRRKQAPSAVSSNESEGSEDHEGPAEFAEADDDWRPLIAPTVTSIEAVLDECTTLEEFQGRLGEVVARDDQREFVSSLAQVMFAGRIAGRVGMNTDGSAADD